VAVAADKDIDPVVGAADRDIVAVVVGDKDSDPGGAVGKDTAAVDLEAVVD